MITVKLRGNQLCLIKMQIVYIHSHIYFNDPNCKGRSSLIYFFSKSKYQECTEETLTYPEALWFDVVADEVVEQKEFLLDRSSTPSV